MVTACWKFNLDFGADAVVLGGDASDTDLQGLPAACEVFDLLRSAGVMMRDAESLALKACSALGLAYGAVDVVLISHVDHGSIVKPEPESCQWSVLEVNACPAWNHFLSTHSRVAHRSIHAVITAAFDIQFT